MFTALGKVNAKLLEKEFGKLKTDEVIVTNERMEHIKNTHPQDVEIFKRYARAAVQNPDIIIKDMKNSNSVFVVCRLENTNLNLVISLALEGFVSDRKNSVITSYRIRDRNLKKLKNNNKVLYKRE